VARKSPTPSRQSRSGSRKPVAKALTFRERAAKLAKNGSLASLSDTDRATEFYTKLKWLLKTYSRLLSAEKVREVVEAIYTEMEGDKIKANLERGGYGGPGNP
jgi:hypothetical protein